LILNLRVSAQSLYKWFKAESLSKDEEDWDILKKAGSYKNRYSIKKAYKLLGVIHSGFYKWVNKPFSDRYYDDLRLLAIKRDRVC